MICNIVTRSQELHTLFPPANVKNCQELEDCILWTEGECAADGTRQVCIKTGNQNTAELGSCSLGNFWLDAACLVADAERPGGKPFLMPPLCCTIVNIDRVLIIMQYLGF